MNHLFAKVRAFPKRIPVIRSIFLSTAVLIASHTCAYAQTNTSLTQIRYEEPVRSILYMPMYVALDKGYFRDEGLDVQLKTSHGADKATAALLSGSADIAMLGPELTVYVANSESPVKLHVFAGLTATDGFQLLSREPVENFDWSMLKDKRVMSFRHGSSPDIFLLTAMAKHGLDAAKDVQLISNIGPAARAGAWMSDQADFGIFLEPEAGNLEREGYGQVVAAIGKEVGNVDFSAFTATDKFLAENADVARAWVKAVYRAQKEIQSAPAAELAAHLKPYFPGLDEETMIPAIERYHSINLWKLTPVVEQEAMEKWQDMLVATDMLESDKRVKFENLVDNSFAKEVSQ